jgi:hypothetical protein
MGGTLVRSFWIAVASFSVSLRATEGDKCITFRANDCRININFQERTHLVTSGRLNLERINPRQMPNLYLINASKSAAADKACAFQHWVTPGNEFHWHSIDSILHRSKLVSLSDLPSVVCVLRMIKTESPAVVN